MKPAKQKKGKPAMIEIDPKTHPNVGSDNGVVVHFMVAQDCTTNSHLWGAAAAHAIQLEAISEVKSVLMTLGYSFCDATLSIGVRTGQPFLDGQVGVYSRAAQENSQTILRVADHMNFDFSRRFPRSSFTIRFSQIVTKAEVYSFERS